MIVTVNEEETVASCLSFVRDYQLLVGGSTGAVLAAIRNTASEFRAGETIVAISPDLGDRYLDTIYNPDWVAETIRSNVQSPTGERALPAAIEEPVREVHFARRAAVRR